MLIAAGFALVGDVVLRRSSKSMAEWNSSLIVGMGVCAALLFPVSLVARQYALTVTLLMMTAGAALACIRRLRGRRRFAPVQRLGSGIDWRVLALPGTLAAGAALAFVALDLRYGLMWDGFAVWASKAQRLFVEGRLTRDWYLGAPYDSLYVAYPPLVPLYQALVSRLRGRFDFDGLKICFVVFYFSIAASVYTAVRARASSRLAAWSTTLVLFVPALSTRWAAGGYADMPQAAGVAAVVAAGLQSDLAALPWLIGALTVLKPEGVVLALLASAAGLAAWRAQSPRPRVSGLRNPALVVAAFVAMRIAYVRWTAVHTKVYAIESLHQLLSRVPEVARLAVREMLSVRAWGLIWPAFFVSVVVLFRRGDQAERALAGATAVAVVAMAGPFLATTWPVRLHFEQAYFRLLAQLAPAAVVAAALAYSRASATIDAESRSTAGHAEMRA